MRFVAYRLPQKVTQSTPPLRGEANEFPEVLVWVRKYGADADAWVLLDEKGKKTYGGWNVDPDVGGIRFDKPQYVVADSGGTTVFRKNAIRVTAAIETGERLFIERYRPDYKGETLHKFTQDRFRKWLRWNAVAADGTTVDSDVVLDETPALAEYCERLFSSVSRHELSARFVIPWVETLYDVGDFVENLRSGASGGNAAYGPTSLPVNAPVVGVDMEFQTRPYKTVIYTDNREQAE
jgi:hypothetical protein